MPRPTNPGRFAPPISLGDVDAALVGAVARYCVGARCKAPKDNEMFRYAVGTCFVIGYRHRAVVTGSDPRTMRALAAEVRQLMEYRHHPERCPHAQTACCPHCGVSACFLCNCGHRTDCERRPVRIGHAPPGPDEWWGGDGKG